MAVLILLCGGKFRKCFSEGTEAKYRIVAETARSPRNLEYFSVDTIRDDRQGTSAFRERNSANEMRGALSALHDAHFTEKFFDSVRIRRLRSGVSRRMNPGRAAKRRHDQPGIVCEDEAVTEPRVMQGLARSIFRECWRIFLERGQRMEIRQQRQFKRKGDRRRVRKQAILGEFSRIG